MTDLNPIYPRLSSGDIINRSNIIIVKILFHLGIILYLEVGKQSNTEWENTFFLL